MEALQMFFSQCFSLHACIRKDKIYFLRNSRVHTSSKASLKNTPFTLSLSVTQIHFSELHTHKFICTGQRANVLSV